MTNHYQLGLRTHVRPVLRQRYRSGVISVGGTGVLGTGIAANLGEEMAGVRAEMDGEEKQMFNQVNFADPATPEYIFYKAVWRPFYDSFRDFEENHRSLTGRALDFLISPLLTRSTFQDIQNFRERFVAIHDKAKEVGFQFAGPDPTPPKQGDIAAFGSHVESLIKTVIVITLVVVGGFLVLKILQMRAGKP